MEVMTLLFLIPHKEMYSESSQIFTIELFAKLAKSFKAFLFWF